MWRPIGEQKGGGCQRYHFHHVLGSCFSPSMMILQHHCCHGQWFAQLFGSSRLTSDLASNPWGPTIFIINLSWSLTRCLNGPLTNLSSLSFSFCSALEHDKQPTDLMFSNYRLKGSGTLMAINWMDFWFREQISCAFEIATFSCCSFILSKACCWSSCDVQWKHNVLECAFIIPKPCLNVKMRSTNQLAILDDKLLLYMDTL